MVRPRWNDFKSFFKELPSAVVFAVILGVVAFVASRPATSIEAPWPYFQVLQRHVLWLVRSTAFRSIVAPLALLVSYGAFYYTFGVRGRRFIVVSDFRVWGSLEKKTPAKGVAGRLQDELMRLLAEMRAPKPGLPPERSMADSANRSLKAGTPKSKPELGGGFVPDTQVTVQYEGISLEGLHTFFRRYTKREVVITGELLNHPNGFLIVARTKDHGPWEILIRSLDALSLRIGLQRLAIRILTTLSQGFLPIEANNFVFLQFKAIELEEYDLAVRLAELALDAAPRRYKNEGQRNLAAAHIVKGFWLTEKNQHKKAIVEYEKATESFPQSWQAWNNLGLAYKELGEKEKSDDAFRKADKAKENAIA